MINLYCDESCHLENDSQTVMLIGAVACPDYAKESVYSDIKEIKKKHSISFHNEIKWVKVSNSKVNYYLDLVRYFFHNDLLAFRCVMLPDKSKLRHDDFNQTHDDFYYKMYYYVISKFLNTDDKLKVFIDIKDTKSSRKTKKLKEILSNYACDRYESIDDIVLLRSHENSILQLADLLIGAISYKNRNLSTNDAKVSVCNEIISLSGNSLTHTTPYSNTKFNILILEKVK